MSEEWKHAGWVSGLGTWAWVIGILSGVVNIIWGISVLATLGVFGVFGFGLAVGLGRPIWLIISGIIAILICFAIIRPKFSKKCHEKDWDSLLNWVMGGSIRFPWMLFWGIMVEIFGYGWGGFAIIIPALVLIFAGPTKFEWKKEK
ncbi:MAG: hypothetical protein ACXAEX_07185 [Promethearchaeota archaeon]|jgi:hypothetical protein